MLFSTKFDQSLSGLFASGKVCMFLLSPIINWPAACLFVCVLLSLFLVTTTSRGCGLFVCAFLSVSMGVGKIFSWAESVTICVLGLFL
jgi:hypothetical protein